MAAVQDGSTADPPASCEAPVCLRDVTPRAPAPGSLVLLAGGYQATLRLQTTLSSLPLDGCISHSCCDWEGENLIEYDFGGGWEEGGRK